MDFLAVTDHNIDIIQTIIQGGAIGVLLVFGYGAYKLANKIIDKAFDILTNHFDHLVKAVETLTEKGNEWTDKLDDLVTKVQQSSNDK